MNEDMMQGRNYPDIEVGNHKKYQGLNPVISGIYMLGEEINKIVLLPDASQPPREDHMIYTLIHEEVHWAQYMFIKCPEPNGGIVNVVPILEKHAMDLGNVVYQRMFNSQSFFVEISLRKRGLV